MGIFPLFFLCLYFGSGSSFAQKPPLKAIQRDQITHSQENQIPHSDSAFASQLDTIPVVNPSPMTPTPIYTSPPFYTSPPAPITQPITTPTTPQATTPPATTTPAASGGSWCIASQTASDTALQVALDYACGYGGADCSGIQPGAPCYNPTTVRDHASYAFNDYYQKSPIPTSCVFGGTAQLTSTDPSSGNCHYATPRSTPSTTTTTTPTPMVPSPVVTTPMVPTTPSLDTPPGSSIYGSEPTGMPSSAVAVACSRVLLLVVTTGLLGSAIASAY